MPTHNVYFAASDWLAWDASIVDIVLGLKVSVKSRIGATLRKTKCSWLIDTYIRTCTRTMFILLLLIGWLRMQVVDIVKASLDNKIIGHTHVHVMANKNTDHLMIDVIGFE